MLLCFGLWPQLQLIGVFGLSEILETIESRVFAECKQKNNCRTKRCRTRVLGQTLHKFF
jgi:hypothetical protein